MNGPETESQRELHAIREAMRKGVRDAWPVLFHSPVKFEKLAENEIFKIPFYRDLAQHPLLGDYARHDLGPVANGALGFFEMVAEDGYACKEEKQRLQTEVIMREYLLVLEDILLRLERFLDIKREETPEPVSVDLMSDLVKDLEITLDNEINAEVTVNFLQTDTEASELSGVDAAMVYNGIRNIMSNAVKKEIQSSKVTLLCEVGKDSMLFTITDDGIGMLEGRLDPENERYIFKKGVSGRGSSGLGLSKLDSRYAERGIGLTVASGEHQYSNREVQIVPPKTGTTFHIEVPFSKK